MKTFIAVLFFFNGEWVMEEGFEPIDTGSETRCYQEVQPQIHNYMAHTLPAGIWFVTDCVTQEDVDNDLEDMKVRALANMPGEKL